MHRKGARVSFGESKGAGEAYLFIYVNWGTELRARRSGRRRPSPAAESPGVSRGSCKWTRNRFSAREVSPGLSAPQRGRRARRRQCRSPKPQGRDPPRCRSPGRSRGAAPRSAGPRPPLLLRGRPCSEPCPPSGFLRRSWRPKRPLDARGPHLLLVSNVLSFCAKLNSSDV